MALQNNHISHFKDRAAQACKRLPAGQLAALHVLFAADPQTHLKKKRSGLRSMCFPKPSKRFPPVGGSNKKYLPTMQPSLYPMALGHQTCWSSAMSNTSGQSATDFLPSGPNKHLQPLSLLSNRKGVNAYSINYDTMQSDKDKANISGSTLEDHPIAVLTRVKPDMFPLLTGLHVPQCKAKLAHLLTGPLSQPPILQVLLTRLPTMAISPLKPCTYLLATHALPPSHTSPSNTYHMNYFSSVQVSVTYIRNLGLHSKTKVN